MGVALLYLFIFYRTTPWRGFFVLDLFFNDIL